MSDLPDGLAHGKARIFQVNTTDARTGQEEPPTIFEFYTEYGEDGVVTIRTDGQEMYVSVQALISFVTHWRNLTEEARE